MLAHGVAPGGVKRAECARKRSGWLRFRTVLSREGGAGRVSRHCAFATRSVCKSTRPRIYIMNKCDIGTGEHHIALLCSLKVDRPWEDALDAGQGASPGGSRRFLWDVSALHPMLLLFCGSVFPPTMRWITKFSAQLSCSAVSVVEQDYHYGSEIASAPESTPNSRRQGAMGRHGTRSRGQTRPSGGC